MKKLYTILLGIAITVSASAQKKMDAGLIPFATSSHKTATHQTKSLTAVGDTLLFFDGTTFYGDTPAVDFANFDNDVFDIDGLTINPAIEGGFSDNGSYTFFYSVDSVSGDSSFYFGTYSWFNPVGQSDDWFTFGPVNIPANGSTLEWQHRFPDNDFRDGYEVVISDIGYDPTAGEFDAGTIIYNLTDNAPSSSGDTAWTNQSVDIPAQFDGTPVWIGFHHDANDMFIIYLDDVALVEGHGSASIKESDSNISLTQNYPNPVGVGAVTTVAYQLKNASKVSMKVYDLTGKIVADMNAGLQAAGSHSIFFNTSSLSSGVYTYSLTAGESTISNRMIVK